MNLFTIFVLQFVLTLLVYSLIARWYLSPWLKHKTTRFALSVLITPHALRHLGLAFLVPGLTSETIPIGFARAAAYGDFISGLLAILVLLALRYRWRFAIPAAWGFSLIGTTDLLYALSHASAIPHLGTTWLIPTFIVPGLLVTHAMVFARLTKLAWIRSASNKQQPVGKVTGVAHAS